jgi:TfdA family taurine catabolism dioxygenase TauD
MAHANIISVNHDDTIVGEKAKFSQNRIHGIASSAALIEDLDRLRVGYCTARSWQRPTTTRGQGIGPRHGIATTEQLSNTEAIISPIKKRRALTLLKGSLRMPNHIQLGNQLGDRLMPAPFPDTARIDIPAALARELLQAAERLPLYHNKEFYSLDLQLAVHDRVRDACPVGFDWLIEQIKLRIAQWPYSALLRGLQFDDGNRLFVAINRAFGNLVARPYEEPRAQLVHYIQPSSDLQASYGSQYESEKLHTDTADWETPVELISMVCVRADINGGGRSRVLDVDTLREEVQKRLGAETLELLETEPVPWQVADYLGGGKKWRTVLTESSVCWRRYTINLALDSAGAKLSAPMSAALDAFEDVVASTPGTLEFLMCEGELLFVDNHRTIHSRTPLVSGNASDRLMIRSWIKAVATEQPGLSPVKRSS